MSQNKKTLKQQCQQEPRPMGIYQIRNLVNEKVLVGSSLNLPGIFNRHRFSLRMGGHSNKALQAEWNEFGGGNFAFEILDELTPRPEPGYDHRPDLAFLEDMWLEKLQPYGERGYNEKKKTREERLRMIAANRAREEDDEL